MMNLAAYAGALALLLSPTPFPAAAQTYHGPREVRTAICTTFRGYCSQALRVAWCESRYNVYARNGQYLGLFQMGSYARGRYGHSWSAWGQARAAYRYFRDSGYSWGPWACKP